jgi:serine/threonine protein kinase
MLKAHNKDAQPSDSVQGIPLGLRGLTAIGDLTTKAVQNHLRETLLPGYDEIDLTGLAEAFRKAKWTDEQAAQLFEAYSQAFHSGNRIEPRSLIRWVLAHEDDASAVLECVRVVPPEEIEIIRVLSRAGSQKLVFLGTWRLTLEDIVLKKIIAPDDNAEKILSRELRSNPLNMVHPNIIETYFLPNRRGERFLVEKRLSLVLNDAWRAKGIHEAANLLFDIAKALKFLHDKGLVHGDVKPDNIGKRFDDYVLLDFGICRTKESFTPETSATGSLRTRAPELLAEENILKPEMADVWALGATVFNSLVGRFPLIHNDEKVPRISKPAERQQFEKLLATRVASEWDRMVDVSSIPAPLNEILETMLERDPRKRVSMEGLLNRAHSELCAFLRSESSRGGVSARFSPVNELMQIRSYIESVPNLQAIIPASRKQSILAKLKNLQNTSGFGDMEKRDINNLITTLDK